MIGAQDSSSPSNDCLATCPMTKIVIGWVSGLTSIRYQANDTGHWGFIEALEANIEYPMTRHMRLLSHGFVAVRLSARMVQLCWFMCYYVCCFGVDNIRDRITHLNWTRNLWSACRHNISGVNTSPWIIMCMRLASERRRYIVTPSLIGWAQTQNDPYMIMANGTNYYILL